MSESIGSGRAGRVPLAVFLFMGLRVRDGEGPNAWGRVVLCVLYMLVL